MSAEGTRNYSQDYNVVFEAAKNAVMDSKGKLKSADPNTGEIKAKGKSDMRTMMGEKIKIRISRSGAGTQVYCKAKAEGASITSLGKTDETVKKFFAALDGRLMGGGATPPASGGSPCATCGQPLAYIDQYQRWYCHNCKKYA